MTAITLNLQPTIELTDEQFASICSINRDLKLERTATGELIIMPPIGGETGKRNSNINAQLWLWNQQAKLGEVFDSSTGFKLPIGWQPNSASAGRSQKIIISSGLLIKL